MPAPVLCSIGSCGLPSFARGWCASHYANWSRCGDPLADRADYHDERRCTVDYCERRLYAKGYCARHYRQWRKHGRVLDDVTAAPALCAVDGCDRRATERGMCHGHYLRWGRTGDVKADVPLEPRRRPPCHINGCERPSKARGMCSTHYSRERVHGNSRPDIPVRRAEGNGWISHGYFYVAVPPELRYLTKGETNIAEHRLVMAQMLGRPLRDDESVHHINGDRLDNRPENLELWSRWQPRGQRVIDKTRFAVAFLVECAPELLHPRLRGLAQTDLDQLLAALADERLTATQSCGKASPQREILDTMSDIAITLW